MSAVPDHPPPTAAEWTDARLEELQRLNDMCERLEDMVSEAYQRLGAAYAILRDVAEEIESGRNGWQQGMLARIKKALE